MYKIVRKGKAIPKVLKNVFDSYEEARNAVRKWLLAKHGTRILSEYGFSVSKFAQ